MSFSTLSRLVRRLFQALTTRPITRSAFKPTLEALDQRAMPALFTWTDATGDDQYSDPYNWQNTASVLSIPGPGDDILFTNFGASSGGPSTGGGMSAGGSAGGSPGDCYGLQSPATGAFNSITLTSGFTGTVTVTGPVQTDALYVNNGTIDQPAGSGSDITVLGGATTNDYTWWLYPGWEGGSDFNWTGGTLNSTSSVANLWLVGVTANITPGAGSTVTTGDNLELVGTTVANVGDGEVDFQNGAGVDVEDSSCLSIDAPNYGATFTRVNPNGVDGQISIDGYAASVHVFRPDLMSPADTWTSDLPVNNNGGKFWVSGGAIAALNGTTGPAGQSGSYIQNGGGSTLLIENGSTLKVQNGAYLGKGVLATAPTNTAVQQNAVIDGNLTDTGASVWISSLRYDPTDGPHKYATLEVTGNVVWTGGTYHPYLSGQPVDPTNPNSTLICDVWQADGTFTITTGANGAKLRPKTTVADPAGNGSWNVIKGMTVTITNGQSVLFASIALGEIYGDGVNLNTTLVIYVQPD